jgi:hypothetical protein
VSALVLTIPFHAFAQGAPSADGQGSKSAPFASALVQLLEASNLTSIAAKHGDRYVAALYIPGSQLLVVAGQFPGQDRMSYLLGQKSYRDAYVDLSGASEQASRVLFSDLGADGLRFGREKDQPFDMVAVAGKGLSFDRIVRGNRAPAQDEYAETYTSMDEQYSQLLQVLIAAMKKPS